MGQTLHLARNTPGLLQTALDTLITGLALTLAGLAPLVLALVFLPDSLPGGLLVGFFTAMILVAQLLTAYVYSGRTASLVFRKLTSESGEAAPILVDLRHRWLDLLSLGMGMLTTLWRASRPGRPAWARALYLARPVMVAEGCELTGALARTDQMVRSNLLMMSPGQVGVSWVNAVAGSVFTALGGGLGFVLASNLLRIARGTPLGSALAMAAGVLVASLFILVAAALCSLNAAAYHTSLYVWSINVEQNRSSGRPAYAAPPAPLAVTLAGIASLSAPIYSD
ncbi:MAG: hypothetical protein PHQ40_10915 [Anaerolineaceae bacterium]|nr:hypothetical protein [Anaerolineaceae bacterium]